MERIKWIRASDSFVISRELLADICDWANNVYRNHYNSYDEEDLLELKEELDDINSVLLKYMNFGDVKYKKLKVL